MIRKTLPVRFAHMTSPSVESYNTLRTNLMYTENLQVIALTSTIPDEGKSTTSIQLALSFAKLNKKVLLVDADLRKGSLRRYLPQREKLVGLSELILGNEEYVVYDTDIDNFYLLYSGKLPPNPSELLSGNNFKKVIDQLKKQFDYIIIDTPPMTVAPDATVIGKVADGTVFVIRNDFVNKSQVKRVKKEFDLNQIRIVGTVLTRVKKNQVDYANYGYYGHYYK